MADRITQVATALQDHEDVVEGALSAVYRHSPLPFERPGTDAEHTANAIVQAANIQAAVALAINARRYVTA